MVLLEIIPQEGGTCPQLPNLCGLVSQEVGTEFTKEANKEVSVFKSYVTYGIIIL